MCVCVCVCVCVCARARALSRLNGEICIVFTESLLVQKDFFQAGKRFVMSDRCQLVLRLFLMKTLTQQLHSFRGILHSKLYRTVFFAVSL